MAGRSVDTSQTRHLHPYTENTLVTNLCPLAVSDLLKKCNSKKQCNKCVPKCKLQISRRFANSCEFAVYGVWNVFTDSATEKVNKYFT